MQMFNILISFNEKIKDFEMNLKKDVCVTLQNAEFGVTTYLLIERHTESSIIFTHQPLYSVHLANIQLD